jgi:hypothetical protein
MKPTTSLHFNIYYNMVFKIKIKSSFIEHQLKHMCKTIQVLHNFLNNVFDRAINGSV